MPDVKEIWSEALPDIMNDVTGVGVWTALKASVPIALEEGQFVLGIPSADSELIGHLKIPSSRRAIETKIGKSVNENVNLRVIIGTTDSEWETEKIRDAEKRKIQDRALQRHKDEVAAGKSWEQIYDQLSRNYASMANRSLPQVRAKYLTDAVSIVSQALTEMPVADDMAERNYARCLERIAQYADVPSTIVAIKVLEHTFEG